MAKCAGITRAGTACKGTPIDGSQWCFVHHPDHVEERRRYGSRGGKRAGRGRPQVEVSGIKTQLQDLADGVLDGSIDRADGAVVSQILNVLLRALKLELEIKEQEEFAERLEALERALTQRSGNGRWGA
jgi:hypothetical protein